MKHSLIALLACACAVLSLHAQTADELVRSGLDKHRRNDYAGALADYSRALALDTAHTGALYNRGVVYLLTEEFDRAERDLTTVLGLLPSSGDAYYSRASVYARTARYPEALADLDRLIALDTAFPNALVLRGQIRVSTGDAVGGCIDLALAKRLGDSNADSLFSALCGNEPGVGEVFSLHWPDEERWKILHQNETADRMEIQIVRGEETEDNWTQLGYMASMKGARNAPLEQMMALLSQQAAASDSSITVTLVGKDLGAAHPWIMFKVESPTIAGRNHPESQLWFVIQGDDGLYMNFRALRAARLPAGLQKQWEEFFRSGTIVRIPAVSK